MDPEVIINARTNAFNDTAMQQWAKAEAYFAGLKDNPFIVKYRRKDSGLNYSFIKINGTIYIITHVLLGVGAYSKVKLAFDKNGRQIALNITAHIKPKILKSDPEQALLNQMNRFFGSVYRESRTVKQFFLKRFSHFQKINKLYMATEVIDGVTLEKALLNGQYQDSTEALILAFRIAQALYELHEKYGHLHCDIKPSNIMVSGFGAHIKVKLIDFGFSQKRKALGDEDIRLPCRMGTHYYMAKEIKNKLANKAVYSIYSDVYALGVTFGILPDVIPGFLSPHLYKTLPEVSPFHKDFIVTIGKMCASWPYNYSLSTPLEPLRPNTFKVCQAILMQLKLLPKTAVLEDFFQILTAEARELNAQATTHHSFSEHFFSGLTKMMSKVEEVVKKLCKSTEETLNVTMPPLTLRTTTTEVDSIEKSAQVSRKIIPSA